MHKINNIYMPPSSDVLGNSFKDLFLPNVCSKKCFCKSHGRIGLLATNLGSVHEHLAGQCIKGYGTRRDLFI